MGVRENHRRAMVLFIYRHIYIYVMHSLRFGAINIYLYIYILCTDIYIYIYIYYSIVVSDYIEDNLRSFLR